MPFRVPDGSGCNSDGNVKRGNPAKERGLARGLLVAGLHAGEPFKELRELHPNAGENNKPDDDFDHCVNSGCAARGVRCHCENLSSGSGSRQGIREGFGKPVLRGLACVVAARGSREYPGSARGSERPHGVIKRERNRFSGSLASCAASREPSGHGTEDLPIRRSSRRRSTAWRIPSHRLAWRTWQGRILATRPL